ncbi:MAG: hypothetical protein K8S99_09665 [Planctomycetes bacterium]|nr:hypothetical protein [Planctomycetota bacterium]
MPITPLLRRVLRSINAGRRTAVRVPMLETLEARNLLTVDITGAFVGLGQVTTGQLNPVTVKVQNLGDEIAKNAGSVQFYLSTDGTLDINTDIALGKPFKVAGKLGAAGSISDQLNIPFNVMIPYDTVAGDYTLFAVTDSLGKVAESDETNNTAAGAVTVLQPDYNLFATVTDPKVPLSVVEGKDIRGSVKVNIMYSGAFPLTGKPPKISIKLVARPAVEPIDRTSQDIVIGLLTGRNIAGLRSDAGIKSFSANVLLPSDLADGDWKVIAIVDSDHQIAETDEDDNEGTLADTIHVAPAFTDVVVSSATQPYGANANLGDKGVGTVTLRNLGNIPLKGVVAVRLVARPVGAPDTSFDVVIGETNASVNMKPGTEGKPIKVNVQIANTLTDGLAYDIIPIVAPVIGFNDSDATDNEGDPLGPVTVHQPDYDLSATLSSVLVSAAMVQSQDTPGKLDINITYTGSTPIGSDAPKINVRIVARPNDAVDDSQDALIGLQSNVSIAGLDTAHNVKTVTAKVLFPANMAPGDYGIFAIVDPDNRIAELDETNNEATDGETYTTAQAFTDVSIIDLGHSYAQTAVAGNSAKAFVTLHNRGNVPVNGVVTIQFLAHRTDQAAADVVIGSRDTPLSLAAGVGSTTSKSFILDTTLPDTLAENGVYQIVAKMIPVSGFVDTQELGNELPCVGTVTVSLPPPYLLLFGDTFTLTMTSHTPITGDNVHFNIQELGNFVSTNGVTGIYTYNYSLGTPFLAHQGAFSLTTSAPGVVTQAQFTTMIFNNLPLENLDGKTITFGANLANETGKTTVRIYQDGIGVILETNGEFKIT